MAKKKQTPFGIFVRMFTKTLGVMLLMMVVGFVSYYITLNYYRANKAPVDDAVKDVVLDIVSDAKVTEIAQNLICVTGKDGDIRYAVLEIFNTVSGKLDYITLPTQEDMIISNDLYQRLYAVNAQVPQVIRMCHLDKYFDKSTVYEYAEIIAGEMLDTEISFYTVMSPSQFQKIFKMKHGFSDGTTTKIASWKKSFRKACAKLDGEKGVSDYIKKLYDKGAVSNLSVGNRQKYAEKLARLKKSDIHFYPSYLKSDESSGNYVYDNEKTAKLLSNILANSDSCYDSWLAEATMVNAEKSTDKRIYIANGARVSGLASSYQTILVGDGYQVTGIGNYTDELLEDTRILVREEGMGQDLLSYFNNASIETADLPDDIDIEIILGTADAG